VYTLSAPAFAKKRRKGVSAVPPLQKDFVPLNLLAAPLHGEKAERERDDRGGAGNNRLAGFIGETVEIPACAYAGFFAKRCEAFGVWQPQCLVRLPDK